MLATSENEPLPLSGVSPAVVEVELWRRARGLADRAVLGSGRRRMGGRRYRRASYCLASLCWRLAGLHGHLTRLGGHLAGLGASLAGLCYRDVLVLGAVFLGHWALLLRAGARVGSCDGQKLRDAFTC